jgi:hypothetical protein
MDFNYGTTTNTATHKLYKSVQTSDGLPFANTVSVSIDVADLPPATYYWSVTARTDTTGYRSVCSSAYVWTGPNVTTYNPSTGQGGLTYNQLNGTSISGITRVIAGVNWSIPNNSTGNVLLPVPVTTSTVNVPVIVPPAPTIYSYPAFTGNSSTSGGTGGNKYYAANSTGPSTPKNAWTLGVASGDDNWWAVVSEAWTPGLILSYESGRYNAGITLIADTDNTIVQFVTGYELGGGYYSCDTSKLNTLTLSYAQAPYVATYLTTTGTGSNTVSGAAVMLRVIYGGNVTVASGTLAISATPIPYV